MSEELLSAVSVIVVQVGAVIILVLKGRKTEVKLEAVDKAVQGQCLSLEALLAAQRATRKRGRPRKEVDDEVS